MWLRCYTIRERCLETCISDACGYLYRKGCMGSRSRPGDREREQEQGHNMNIWNILGIEPTTDKKAIRKAYAAKTKEIHPEDAPEEFKRLHEAYQAALGYADYVRQVGQSGGSVTSFYKTEESAPEDAERNTADDKEEDVPESTGNRTQDSETVRTDETTEEPGREDLRAYFEESQEKHGQQVAAFLNHWKAFQGPYQDQEAMDWWKEYLSSKEFQDIRYQSQVLETLADEIDNKCFYGINEVKMLFWEAYGFRGDEETAYQGDRQRLYRSLYPAYEKQRQNIQYEQKWARNDKILRIFIGIVAAALLAVCIMIPVTIHRQRENGRRFLADYMAQRYPAAGFSRPERIDKDSSGNIVYRMRPAAHPELSVTATVETAYVEGEKAYQVTEDYGQLIFELYAAQYGLEAGRVTCTEGPVLNYTVTEYSALFYFDEEELDAFCETAEKMFAEQEELQTISEVAVCTEYVLFPEILFQGGVEYFPFADMQIYDFRGRKASEISAMLRDAYMRYMFQYESWNITTAQYREWGAAYEKICEEWEDDNGEWHEVYDPDTGEYLCRLFIPTYEIYDGYYSSNGNMPSLPRTTRMITAGNAYYFLQDREADLHVEGDGSGFTVEFYGTDMFVGENPEVEFYDLRNYY